MDDQQVPSTPTPMPEDPMTPPAPAPAEPAGDDGGAVEGTPEAPFAPTPDEATPPAEETQQ